MEFRVSVLLHVLHPRTVGVCATKPRESEGPNRFKVYVSACARTLPARRPGADSKEKSLTRNASHVNQSPLYVQATYGQGTQV